MKWILAICACVLVASIAVANPFVLKSEVKTVADGPVQGTWITTEFGILGSCHKNGRVELPFAFAYLKGQERGYPYSLRFDNDTGDLLLQMPIQGDERVRLIPLKHIERLVEASLKVRHAGEYWSGDKVEAKRPSEYNPLPKVSRGEEDVSEPRTGQTKTYRPSSEGPQEGN